MKENRFLAYTHRVWRGQHLLNRGHYASFLATVTESKKQLLLDVMLKGHNNFSTQCCHYQAIWEEFIHRYNLIKVCSVDAVNDLFVLECNEDSDVFVVFVGSMRHINRGWNIERIAEIIEVIDFQIHEDEITLLKLTI